MDQCIELICNGLSDHFSSWNKFGIESMKNVFKVFPFSWFFRVEKLKEFLNKSMGYKNLQGLNITNIVQDQLVKEFINGLEK